MALALPTAAQASYFDSASLTKLPGKVRVSTSFHFQAPECLPDEYGYYAFECETGDMAYRVSRRVNYVWRGVYSESSFLYTNSYPEAATDVTRLYYSLFRGYFKYAFTPGSQCFRYRVKITLVDSFLSTSNPSRLRYFKPAAARGLLAYKCV